MTITGSRRLALDIADRLIDVAAVTKRVNRQDRGSLSGLAGTALLHARLSTVDGQFAAAAVEHWNHAAAYARQSRGIGSGTFSGPGSVAASLILGTPYLPDPQQLQSHCAAAARWLCGHALSIAEQLHGRVAAGLPLTSWVAYDAVCGLAGIGRVLMTAVDQGHQHARVGLDISLRALTAMTNNSFGSRPGWWIAADARPTTTHVHPCGAAATGIAHGIAGPLALLATAYAAGHRVPQQDNAIRTSAEWLLHWQNPDTDTWPPHVSGDALNHNNAGPILGRHDAWCYGTPGISAALTKAAGALDDDTYQATADHAMRTLAARDARNWDVEGPTVCHGYAGILQASHAYPDLAENSAFQILAAADQSSTYLIQHTEQGASDDDPGLLTGAAGVALALADHADVPSSCVASTRWDSILLLS